MSLGFLFRMFSAPSFSFLLPAQAFDCVCDDAVWCAVHVASRVLEGVPPSVLGRMREQGAALGIFGRHHVVTGGLCV